VLITDVESGVDRTDLGGLDADDRTNQDDPFDFIGTAAFSGVEADAQLRIIATGTPRLYRVELDSSDDGVVPDLVVFLRGDAPVEADFVL
jgi:hypothetical protein